MRALKLQIVGARAERYTAAPTLSFRLRITDSPEAVIESIVLRAQLRIEPGRRHYARVEEERLVELFGTPERWGDTLRTFLWTNTSLMVPAFTGSCEVDVPVPCTYDFDVAASKYFNGLQDGEIPVLTLFSGTIFRRAESGFSVEQIPWDIEAKYRLPLSVWRETMDFHFPDAAWMRLRKDTFDEIYRFKRKRGMTSWDEALTELLDLAGEKI
ncbi:MAG: DUF6084 family protein [Candidatus Eremiobacteraeota bacterium]|nr:DUF6084 family protein [Candidatus Eremiobacteraeota bacterium]